MHEVVQSVASHQEADKSKTAEPVSTPTPTTESKRVEAVQPSVGVTPRHATPAPVATRTDDSNLQPVSHTADQGDQLPQTDETHASWFKALGALLMGAMAYVVARKRH